MKKIRIKKPTSISSLVNVGILPEYCIGMIDFGNGRAEILSQEAIAEMRQNYEHDRRLNFFRGLQATIPQGTFYIREKQESYFPDSLEDKPGKTIRWVELFEPELAVSTTIQEVLDS